MTLERAGPTEQELRVLRGGLLDTARAIMAKYPHPRSASLPLLFLVQSVEGYVTEEGMRDVADLLGLTPAQVLATASFYTMLKKDAQGEYLISICRNITCTHMGARKIIADLEAHLGIQVGDTTPDGKFSLETAECLATCDGAPSGQINYEDVYNLTSDGVKGMVDKLAAGERVKSVRGEPIRTSKEIAREIAMTGTGLRVGEPGEARVVGGEAPVADMAPGFRPKEPGAVGKEEGDGAD
jgi:NADH-quinone oxidoreductase subunit E